MLPDKFPAEKCYKLERTQLIKAPLNEVWGFMSSPANLEKITPQHLRFEVLTKNLPAAIYSGLLIEYYVRPLLGIRMKWITEIREVKPMESFVDTQKKGPYKFWHHYHHLQQTKEGVLMTDVVHYRLPMGVLGKMAHALVVKKQLKTIFDYRYKKLEELF